MDARQRPPDRSQLHNPQTHLSPAQPFPGFAPPASQPQAPIHVPFAADPYPPSRRDPFLPSASQHVRHSSYGTLGDKGAERPAGWANTARPHAPAIHHAPQHHSQAGPHPPPSMTSSSGASSSSPYAYDAARRRSLGGASPPNSYRAPSHDAPPPPPSFARPHMPPPSSPQQQHHNSQRAPYPSAFGVGRELPGLGQAHRPGGSMSISSLIGGGDTGAPTQMSQSQASPPTNTNNHAMQPPSPRRALPSGGRPEFHPFRRQPSPDRHVLGMNASRAPDGATFPAGSPPRSYSNHGSPDQGRPSAPPTSQPYKPMVFQGQRPYAASPNDAYARDSRPPSSSIPPRPNSQPTGPPGSSEPGPRNLVEALGRRPGYGPQEERRRTLGESHHSRPNVAELVGGAQNASSDRDRPSTVQPVAQSAFSPPRGHQTISGPSPPSRTPWQNPHPDDVPRETTEIRREEPSALYRGYGGYSAPPQGPSPFGVHGPEDMVRGRSLDHLSQRVVEQYHAPPTSDPQSKDRHRAEQLSRSLSSGGSAYPRAQYEQPRRPGEEMQHSRSFLGFGPDANRRTGRASPLPQAVQGAQAQPLSIGKDPHVKSEFGRMFSGLGGLGSSTPSRGSPMPQNMQDSHPPGMDPSDPLRLQRVGSQNGKTNKRVKDEEGTFDSESFDGRGTPLSARGAKRNKRTHAAIHHHHHAHPHHHHHHHANKPDEPIPIGTPVPMGPANFVQNGAPPAAHHHHHHHAGPHHHHHPPRPALPALPSPKLPTKVHDIGPVLEEASRLPRRHLGSQLYESITELPKPNSSLDDQFGYASKPKRLPRFEVNPINCTFTIRVPRFYLKARQRQQIVLQRHLWGALIYRDDSDPIAAAIHSGWIRGEWDETVDVNLLDPRITAPNNPGDAEDTLIKVPAAPVYPPADMDLQIEILILPPIQEYVGTVEYGISSRKSKSHDGLSFMVNKIRWVEDGMGSRGQERTAAAMKRRLDASATLLSLMSGGDDALRAVNGTAKLHA